MFQESVQKMLKTSNPAEHQALGRKVRGYNGKIWDQRECSPYLIVMRGLMRSVSDKEKIVEEGNYLKFTKSKEAGLRKKLLDTGDRELVEVSVVAATAERPAWA